MSNSSAPATAQPEPTVAEKALQDKISALKAVSNMLFEDLQTYCTTLAPDAAATLGTAIETHRTNVNAFCDGASACVPPIRH